ncbi:MAG: hypothetical protein ACOC8O_01335 [Natronomonas sp.]
MNGDILEKIVREAKRADADFAVALDGVDLDDLDDLEELDEALSNPDDRSIVESTRPALAKLTLDLRRLELELLAGLEGRRDVLEWIQRLSVRTLGEIPDRWYFDLAVQFRGVPDSGVEKTLLSALIADDHRKRDMDAGDALELRQRLIAITIRPTYHAAFRKLRKNAGEYVDADSEKLARHTARLQKYVAMRPALDELEYYQKKTLDDCLAGFDDKQAILEWGRDVELATHGEIPESFVARCYRESSMANVLTGTRTVDRRARELVVAYYLAPHFNRGVRDLSGRATEQPEPDTEDPDREPPEW